jgi:transcriptional regulator with XRE-family HTH domain
MGRPPNPPPLVPRQPATALGWAMRALRRATGWSVTETARRFGCSPSHISRVERGSSKPSLTLVLFYEEQFKADGLLLSVFEVVRQAAEQKRQRTAGGHAPQPKSSEGDASAFIDDTVPHGTLMQPGELFIKTWRIRNRGCVDWKDRRVERQGPTTGPGLITSPRFVDVPDTAPGGNAEISVGLRAPGYPCSSIAYFKMIDTDGFLCFPDDYALGLDVIVRVAGQRPPE